jgi:hypothetical protein
MLITKAEYARRRGVNKSTISRQVSAGIIPTHGPEKLIDPAEADEALARNKDPARGGDRRQFAYPPVRHSESAEVVDFNDAVAFSVERAKGQRLKNELSKLELRRIKGELIDRDAATKAMAEMAQAAVSAWIQWPARAYAEMAAELGVDSATLHQSLDRHVRQYAEEISRAPITFQDSEEKKTISC